MPHSGIYAIENTTTGDCYIGSSCNIERRWEKHRRELRQGKHHSQYLQRAFNKYGEAAFVYKLLEEVPRERTLLIACEQVWIEQTHPAYNMNPNATNNLGMKASEKVKAHLAYYRSILTAEQRKGMTGKRHSEATKLRQSEAALGRKFSPLAIQHSIETRRQRGQSEAQRQATSERNRKRHQEQPFTEEQLKRISESNKATWEALPEEEKQRRIQARAEAKTGKKLSQAAVEQRRETTKELWQKRREIVEQTGIPMKIGRAILKPKQQESQASLWESGSEVSS